MSPLSGIQKKILLPLTGGLIVVLAAVVLVAMGQFYLQAEEQLLARARQTAQALADVKPEEASRLLQQYKAATGNDAMLLAADESPVASTARIVVHDNFLSRAKVSEYTVPVGDTGSTLRILVPVATLRNAAWDATWPLVHTAAIGLVLFVGLAAFLLHTLSKPLRLLTAKVENINDGGKLEIGVIRRSGDEISQLISALQRMLVNLHEEHQQDLLEEKLAAVDRVATNLSNQLTVPLQSLRKTAHHLHQDGQIADRDAVETIRKEIERLELLVDELAYYCKPMPLHLEKLSVNKTLDQALGMMTARLTTANVTVAKHYDDNLPAVRLDPSRMAEACLNLILNAIQAMPNGGELQIRTANDGESVKIDLEDTGNGIAEEAEESVFEPFFSTRADGIGLGLTISRLIIEEHGGRIDFESTPTGTIFRIHLPVE